jgi:predicted DNA-binding antitoxin AbrB/MazE fold protein
MSIVEAIYQSGVFRPLVAVPLRENQRVRLSIEPVGGQDLLAWLEGVRQHRERIAADRGLFPDSAPEIAEDRLRDV